MTGRPAGSEAFPADSLQFREFHGDAELPAIGRLYELAGWGPVPTDIAGLREWFVRDSDAGTNVIMVIADRFTNELLGMTSYEPHHVWLNDRVVVAARGRAQILDPRLRRRSRGVVSVDETDPLEGLQRVAWQRLAERGWDLVYGLPNPKVLRRNELRTTAPWWRENLHVYGPGLRIDIDLAPPQRPPLDVHPGGRIGPEYDALWESARRNLPIRSGVLRTAAAVGSARAHLQRLEFRHPRSGRLLGYAMFESFTSDVLKDLLAVDAEAMHLVVRSMVAWLRGRPPEDRMEWFNSVAHPAYRDALVSAGAYETEWVFSLMLTCGTGAAVELDASSWYVTTGD